MNEKKRETRDYREIQELRSTVTEVKRSVEYNSRSEQAQEEVDFRYIN